MMNIVIPMAGQGSRFAKAGYEKPKPLIPVFGKPMIEVVIENLKPTTPHRFVFIVRREHLDNFELNEVFTRATGGNFKTVVIDEVTDGAARTVLMAKDLIDNDDELMIANCDQFVDVKIDEYVRAQRGLDGLIMTMSANDNKWSYVRVNGLKQVTEVREKVVISSEATVGIYNFSSGRTFVRGAEAMIQANEKVNGEFYVAPVYNYLIRDGARIGIFNVGALDSGMYGLGVPDDLERFVGQKTFEKRIAGEARVTNG